LDEFLNAETFSTLREAQILIERWHRLYNTAKPRSSPNYHPQATAAFVPVYQRPIMH
jgi:hypothetical protein